MMQPRQFLLRFSGILVTLAFLLGAGVQPAIATDPHALYEKRCSRCHMAHGGSFVRHNLTRENGNIIGIETRTEIGALLTDGHGHLKTADDIQIMISHLTAIFNGGAIFQTKCLLCHERAVILARNRLINTQGGLKGRYTGRDMSTFLQTHGRLNGDEVKTVLEMLARQVGG